MQKVQLNNGMFALVDDEDYELVIGVFKSQEDAACAYDRVARKLHEDFAVTNFS